ncbi:glycoside hydrolase family 16 protein [Flavobacterium frigidarium]|jgi:beta-glucanase (GH16 family)|uniref:glycoside hydrolase family 16 protein n=1 Tax=Flavobacterium frigidarium TaxID=99286 RepID=UPI000403BF6F|nr:glycoside hydrolase family 16 protein [Flavobacterium frigidarium]
MKNILLLLLVSTVSFAQQGNRKLVWEENFNGNVLNDKSWNFELGDGCPNCGWGNDERQLYTKDNHEVAEGTLIITAKKIADNYTSTRITTKGKREFKYGYFESRAKLPVGKGIWPAFWMLGSNIDTVGWPKCGEIDILEYVGKERNTVFNSLHTEASHGNTINTKKTEIKGIESGFHVYGIDWTHEHINFFVDGQLMYSFNPKEKNEATWPFDQPFYFLINMAIGGNFGGPDVDDTIFPQNFEIDYIKVYQ